MFSSWTIVKSYDITREWDTPVGMEVEIEAGAPLLHSFLPYVFESDSAPPPNRGGLTHTAKQNLIYLNYRENLNQITKHQQKAAWTLFLAFLSTLLVCGILINSTFVTESTHS